MTAVTSRRAAPQPGRRSSRRVRRTIASVALAAALAAGATGCGLQPKGSYPDDDPRSAVHQLLRATVGQGNGQRACALLTEDARERMAQTMAGTCRSAMDRSIVALSGSPSSGEGTGRAAEDVDLASRVDGDRATIEVSRDDGEPMTFELRRLSPEELERDTEDADRAVGSAPESDWRVDGGAEQLVTETNRLKPSGPDPDPRG